ncbi:ERF family protein [Pseudomonas luteola]|uniref:ERF family protein n=1 Tax=Pseudomonas luteola TaxID=47886 RepID=UPI00123C12F1|nr:ERF family protein [Pseudomonas luteola]QEU28807.1 ERF superfamily protein [Pseudomonas luteola]
MTKSESIAALAKALAAAQNEIENAKKDSTNPHFRSSYSSLAEILDTCRPVLSKNGLSITQMPGFEDGKVSVETMIMHESGEWISSTLTVPVGKQDAQGVGSATSYARRYALAAVVGIAQADDDGEAAIQQIPRNSQPARQAPPQKLVSRPEIDQLKAAIEQSTLNEADFLSVSKISSLDLLPLDKFAGAMAYIKKHQSQGNAA